VWKSWWEWGSERDIHAQPGSLMPRTTALARIACGLALAAGACTSDSRERGTAGAALADSTAALRAEIQRQTDRVIAAWNGDDPAAVAALYATDAVVSADSTYTGREEIRDRWAAPALPALSDLVISDTRITESGEGFVGTGRYTYLLTSAGSAPMQVNGTFRTSWKREQGAWVIGSERLTVAGPEAAD
jgi:uncharacterized protein (TIGR02246 family)